jgi:hypothetical protein
VKSTGVKATGGGAARGGVKATGGGPKGGAKGPKTTTTGPKNTGAKGPRTTTGGSKATAPKGSSGAHGAKAQAPKTGGGSQAASGKAKKGTTTTTVTGQSNSLVLNRAQQQLQKNANLREKVQSRLPAGMDVMGAASDFRNLGQFVAAVNVSNNLGLDFLQLKTLMTVDGLSLGQAIQRLKGLDANTSTRIASAAVVDANSQIGTDANMPGGATAPAPTGNDVNLPGGTTTPAPTGTDVNLPGGTTTPAPTGTDVNRPGGTTSPTGDVNRPGGSTTTTTTTTAT